uniref:G protein gamma domain-containing protein n=1 Tax=Anisakis simplex TaxID=6269 RepID=A0A0M3JLN2_ANISI
LQRGGRARSSQKKKKKNKDDGRNSRSAAEMAVLQNGGGDPNAVNSPYSMQSGTQRRGFDNAQSSSAGRRHDKSRCCCSIQ